MKMRTVVAVLALVAVVRPASAWEEKGHMMINRLAADAMPADTPKFFKDAATRLEYLGPEPDRWRTGAGPQLTAVNGPDHYVDIEFTDGMTFPPNRYQYLTALETKDSVKKYGQKPELVGFLPYRIAELTQTLQSEWRDWHKLADDSDAAKVQRGQVEQDIIYTAGVLGHYVADGSNPHHTSVHHDGWDVKFAPNPNGYTTSEDERAKRPNGFHHRFEGAFVNAAISADDVKPFVAPVKPITSILDDTVAYLRATNSQLIPLYELEKAGKLSTDGTPDAGAKEFTAKRLAAGASELRDIWAYAMKGVPPRRSREDTPAVTPVTAAPAATGATN